MNQISIEAPGISIENRFGKNSYSTNDCDDIEMKNDTSSSVSIYLRHIHTIIEKIKEIAVWPLLFNDQAYATRPL